MLLENVVIFVTCLATAAVRVEMTMCQIYVGLWSWH